MNLTHTDDRKPATLLINNFNKFRKQFHTILHKFISLLIR